jgi:hypothetical protein
MWSAGKYVEALRMSEKIEFSLHSYKSSGQCQESALVISSSVSEVPG